MLPIYLERGTDLPLTTNHYQYAQSSPKVLERWHHFVILCHTLYTSTSMDLKRSHQAIIEAIILALIQCLFLDTYCIDHLGIIAIFIKSCHFHRLKSNGTVA